MASSNFFLESFDHYTSLTDLDDKWNRAGGSVSSGFFGTSVRQGSGHAIGATYRQGQTGNGLYLPSGAGVFRGGDASSFISQNCIYLGILRTSTTARRIWTVYNLTTPGVNYYVVWNTDGSFELFNRSGVSQGATTTLCPGTNTYYNIGISTGAASATGTIELRINNSTVHTWSSVDTRAGGSGGMGIGCIGSDGTSATTGADLYVDNILIFTGSDPATTRLPDIRIVCVVPIDNGVWNGATNSAGNTINNYSYVDEIPYSTSDYLTTEAPPKAFNNPSALSGQYWDLFSNGLVPYSISADAIYVTQMTEYVRGGTRNGTNIIRIGALAYVGSTYYNAGTAGTAENGLLDPSAFHMTVNTPYAPAFATSRFSGGFSGNIIGTTVATINGTQFGARLQATNVSTPATFTDGRYAQFVVEHAQFYYDPTGGWIIADPPCLPFG